MICAKRSNKVETGHHNKMAPNMHSMGTKKMVTKKKLLHYHDEQRA